MRQLAGWAVAMVCWLWFMRLAFAVIERWDRKRGKTNGFGSSKGSFHF